MRKTHPGRALLRRLEEQALAPRGATVLSACSGGPDSVALTSLLVTLAPAHEWRVVVAHVNHNLRPSSWQDECVAVAVASRLGVDVRVRSLDVPSRSEASLRARRYDALTDIASAEGAPVVVTAHTAEDQTESVLLALFRGTGLRGLGGMVPRRRLSAGVELVRPLLRVGRADVMRELGATALPYVRDPSNLDLRYRRNAVRAALAGLRDRFPRLDEAVARCAEIVADEIADAPRAALRRRLRAALEEDAGLTDVPFERIEALLRAQRGSVHIKPGVEVRVVRRKT